MITTVRAGKGNSTDLHATGAHRTVVGIQLWEQSMIVITTDHAAHDPDRFTTPADARRYWEVPARADALLGAFRAAGLVTRPAGDHGLAPIARVHDAGYLAFLEAAFARWQALAGSGPIMRA